MRRTLGVDRVRFRNLVRKTLSEEHAPDGDICVALVSDRTMRRINRDYRGIDQPTDVLSFSYRNEPHSDHVLGEVYVSPSFAAAQAAEDECDLCEEIARLTVHGLLHVLGYEHDTPRARRRMLARQERYVQRHFLLDVPC